MRCAYFDAGVCRSCSLMGSGYDQQVADKDAQVRAALGPGVQWLAPVTGPDHGYRNRAKLVVAGTVERPTLGILDESGHGVDLTDCGLYPPSIVVAAHELQRFVTRTRLAPYDVPSRTGELKYLLVTASPADELMVRFVLRSTEAITRLRKHLPVLRETLPGLTVASANIQPVHAAVLEGDREIPLTSSTELRMRLNHLDLRLPARSFFQTNSEVAAALYRQVAAWVDESAPTSVWDLYCGVGGFALHCAAPGRVVIGVETSEAAVDAARRTSATAALPGTRFLAGDATEFAQAAAAPPDLVIVNPPRRGLGAQLAGWLESSGVQRVVYSSCHLGSMVRDLAAMPSLRPRCARLVDMFPQTAHHEVVALLERV
ncbi:MAG: 23S rRNA (uracil(747)-C(5))-methyltransferase RlmC [Actinobacteria bacterium]|nr:23S rRNA (uracil(747)-C(5))-methyltransferase RlmC [Actinomycetota bacterium]